MRQRNCIFLLLSLFLFAGCGSTVPTNSQTSNTSPITQTPASFTTSDGFAIQGGWFTPTTPDSLRPVAILLGKLDGSYTDWAPLIPDLINNGYVVLAFDERGQGLSNVKNGQTDDVSTFTEADFNQMPQDVEAALSWIDTQSGADSTHVGIIGVDLGANVAFVSSGIDPRIKATVCVSPEFQQGQTVLTGAGISDFHPHNILYLADYGDDNAYPSAQAMADQTESNKLVVGYYGTDHGFLVMNYDDARSRLFSWLNDNL